MTKLSKLGLDPKDLRYYINNLWAVFTLMSNKEHVRLFFKDLFTHTEYKMFAKRLEIARRLLEDESYANIRQQLKVTEHTISTVSNILERDGEGYRIAHKLLSDLDKKYQRKRNLQQDRLERRTRRKLPAETFLGDVLVESYNQLNKSLKKKQAKTSAAKDLPV